MLELSHCFLDIILVYRALDDSLQLLINSVPLGGGQDGDDLLPIGEGYVRTCHGLLFVNGQLVLPLEG